MASTGILSLPSSVNFTESISCHQGGNSSSMSLFKTGFKSNLHAGNCAIRCPNRSENHSSSIIGRRNVLRATKNAISEDHTPNPPQSREEAISQARESLLATVGATVNKAEPRVFRQRAKAESTRVSVEIPVLDISVKSVAETLLQLFSGLFRKGSIPLKIGIFSTDENEAQIIFETFSSHKSEFLVGVVGKGKTIPSDVELVVVVKPRPEHYTMIEKLVKMADKRSIVAFNPEWQAYLETAESSPIQKLFDSFKTVYCFQPLSIQVLISRSDGAVFKFVEKGKPDSSPWLILTNKDGKLSCATKLKKRPTSRELENVLYSVMAANSPLTKTASFVKSIFKK